MIEINLLPEKLRKKKRTRETPTVQIPKELIIGLVGGLVCLLIIIHLILLSFTLGAKMNLSGLEKQWRELAPAKQRVDSVKQEIASIESKMKYMVSLRANKRILWAKMLNAISDDMVRGAWLTRIYFGENTLKIEGSAVSKKGEELINVGKLANNFKEDKAVYSELKGLEIASIQRKNIKSTETVDFVIIAGIKE